MTQPEKPWYLSKGFVGPLVTAILFALRSTGVADIDAGSALGVVYQSAEFVGIIFGMAGRALARTRLTTGIETFVRPAAGAPEAAGEGSGKELMG